VLECDTGIELALLPATKTDEVVAFVAPGHGGPEFDVAVSYLQWSWPS
jgi:hypothetical protein